MLGSYFWVSSVLSVVVSCGFMVPSTCRALRTGRSGLSRLFLVSKAFQITTQCNYAVSMLVSGIPDASYVLFVSVACQTLNIALLSWYTEYDELPPLALPRLPLVMCTTARHHLFDLMELSFVNSHPYYVFAPSHPPF